MLHPDVPDDKKGDPDDYATWRVEHMDAEELAATKDMPLDDMLQMFRDEWYESLDTPEDIAIENAEIELFLDKRQLKH